MAGLLCEQVGPGMREEERTVVVRDVRGRREFLRVPHGFLTTAGENYYLPVGIVQEDKDQQVVLVELPQEGECGQRAPLGATGRPAPAQRKSDMILSDREIRAALARQAIRITPDPSVDGTAWSSTALDLHLGPQLAYWDFSGQAAPQQFRPADSDYDLLGLIAQFTRRIPLPDAGYPIESGKLYLGWTLEQIQLPYRSRIAARVEGKSNLARIGLGVHVTAPTIHAGFGYSDLDPAWTGNPIQLEIWNTGPLPVVVKPGMRICQLIFEQVDGTPEQGYSGQFRIQGPAS